jgi:hypothetical protein
MGNWKAVPTKGELLRRKEKRPGYRKEMVD